MSEKPWPKFPEVDPQDELGWFWIWTPCHGGHVWSSYFVEYWGA